MTPMHPYFRKLIYEEVKYKKDQQITPRELYRYDLLSAKLFYLQQYGSKETLPINVVDRFHKELAHIKQQKMPRFKANQKAWLRPQVMAAKMPQLSINPLKLGSASFSLLRIWLDLGRRIKLFVHRLIGK